MPTLAPLIWSGDLAGLKDLLKTTAIDFGNRWCEATIGDRLIRMRRDATTGAYTVETRGLASEAAGSFAIWCEALRKAWGLSKWAHETEETSFFRITRWTMAPTQ